MNTCNWCGQHQLGAHHHEPDTDAVALVIDDHGHVYEQAKTWDVVEERREQGFKIVTTEEWWSAYDRNAEWLANQSRPREDTDAMA